MRILDPGHSYALRVLDGLPGQEAYRQFVKRIGERYPGNQPPAHPGTIMQEELRAIIDRAEYVNPQTPCAETEAAIGLLKGALLLFEIRAKRVKREWLEAATLDEIILGECCVICGHVKCEGHLKSPGDVK